MQLFNVNYKKNIVEVLFLNILLFSSICSCSGEVPGGDLEKSGKAKGLFENTQAEVQPLGWTLAKSRIVVAPDEVYEAENSVYTLESDLDESRYQNARSMALSGKNSGALEELKILLHRDLPGYLPRISEDQAFHSMLNSQQDSSLSLLIDELKARWGKELKNSWPVVYFQRGDANQSTEPQEFYSKHSIRSGNFSLQSYQFLPTGSGNKNTLAVFGNIKTQQILNVKADATVDLFSLLSNVSWQLQPWIPNEKVNSKSKVPDESDLSFSMMDFSFGVNDLIVETIEEGDEPGTVPGERHSNTSLRVLGEGSILLSIVEGYRVDGNFLMIPGLTKIALSKGHENAQHHSFIKFRNGVFVVSSQHHCDYSNPEIPAVPVQHHIVDFVQLNNQTVKPVSEGLSVASMVITEDEEILLQTGEQLVLLTLKGQAWKKKLISRNMLLHVPLLKKNCVYQ